MEKMQFLRPDSAKQLILLKKPSSVPEVLGRCEIFLSSIKLPPVRVEQTADKSNFALFAEEAERNRTGAGVRANDGADGVDADIHLR